MRRTHRVLLIASVAITATPSAWASSAPTGERPALPAAWSMPDEHPFERLVSLRGQRVSAATLDDVQRELLAASDSLVADPEFVFPGRAGDLNGDGANDVATFEFAGAASQLVLRDGRTGSPLWSVPDAYAAQIGDLTGDGRPEVITLGQQLAWTRPLPPEAPVLAIATNEQTVSARSADGSLLWSVELSGLVERLGDPNGSAAADLEAIVALQTIPDATGDGRRDVFVGTTTFAQSAFGPIVEADLFAGRTLDGSTGSLSGSVTANAVNGMPWVVPVGDVSGDGLADAFTMSAAPTVGGLLTATTLQGVPVWAETIATTFAAPSSADLTGDGSPDLILQGLDVAGLRSAYDGENGGLLWARPDGGYTDLAGDIDGDGGTDLIRVDGMFGSSITATGISGATGSALWTASHPAPDGAMTVHCTCNNDLTGDGVWDPLTAEIVFGDPMTMTVRTLDGSTGATLWAADVDPAHGFPIPLGADVDGDGAHDLGLGYNTEAGITVRALRGPDFAPLWSASAAVEGFSLGFYGDDLDGDHDAEFVVAGLRFVDESMRGSAHAIGRDGRRWSTH